LTDIVGAELTGTALCQVPLFFSFVPLLCMISNPNYLMAQDVSSNFNYLATFQPIGRGKEGEKKHAL
jgi:hypothetical protein